MTRKSSVFRALSMLAVVVAIPACGGGGSAPAASPAVLVVPVVVADVVNAAGTIRTSAPASTYSGLGASAYGALQTARLAAGAGVLEQGAAIDVAAQAHANYLNLNLGLGLVHTEVSSNAGYYGATLDSRLAVAAFARGAATEVIGGTGASGLGSDCVLGLLNTVYHGAALLGGYTHVGLGFALDGASLPMCVADLATATGDSYGQVPASGDMVAYPYPSQTGVMGTFYVGSESPRPSISLFPNATAGTPVIVSIRNADFLNFRAAGTLSPVVTSFVLTDGVGNIIPSAVLLSTGVTATITGTKATDAVLPDGFVELVPLSPLATGTYTATFSVTLKPGAAPVTKTWSFAAVQ